MLIWILIILNFKENQGALVNYWPIQNGTYKDVVAGRDLTSSNPTLVQDRFGNNNAAVRITDDTNYFKLPTGVYFENSFTISIWMITYNNKLNFPRIIDCGNGTQLNNIVMTYSFGTTCLPAAALYNPMGVTSGYMLSSTVISNNIWYHFGLVVNQTLLQLFINGNLVASGALSLSVVGQNRSKCYIGKSNWVADSAPNSDYDEIKFYNTSLSKSDIKNEYVNSTNLYMTSVNTDFYSSLTNYWPINGSLVDVVSSADLDSYSPTLTQDRFGNANGAIKVTNDVNFFWAPHGNYFNTSGFSVTVWFKVYTLRNWSRVFDFGNGESKDNIFVAVTDRSKLYRPIAGFEINRTNYSNELTLGTWYHLGLTVNGTSIVLYVNGVLSAHSTGVFPSTRVQRWINYFGKSGWSADEAADADYDEIKFFDKTLTQKQIIYDYLTNTTPYISKTILKPVSPYTSPTFYSNMTNYWPITDRNCQDFVSDYDLQIDWTPPVFAPDRFAKVNSAYRTNNNSYFSAPPGVYFDTQFTVIAWVNTYSPTDTQSHLINFSYGDLNAAVIVGINTNPYFCMYDVYGTKLVSSTCNVVSSAQVPGIKWMHYALSVSATTAQLYINGDRKVSIGLSSSVPKILRTLCFFGKGNTTLNGEIDQIKIFNTSLTADQIFYDFDHDTSEFMSSVDTSFYSSLVSYWPINGSVVDVIDGKNLTGTPSYVEDRYGVQNSAFKVTSSINMLQAPASTYFNTEFAITLWVYVYSMESQNKCILNFGRGSSGQNIIVTYSSSSATGQPYFYLTLSDSSTVMSTSPYPITSAYWNHFALSVNSTRASLYINSINVANLNLAKPIKVVETTQNYFGYSSSYSNMALDEIKFFGQSLTHEQIVYDYLTNLTSYLALSKLFRFSDLKTADIINLLKQGYDLTDCSGNCSNHGICYKDGTTAQCLCETYYTGSTCDINLNPCSSGPCINNGTCEANMTNINKTSYACECQYSYYGANCQLQEDLCLTVSCSGNGVCQIKGSETVCNCYYLYSGTNCETMSEKKKLITKVVSASSVIAIAVIISLHAVLLLIDLSNMTQAGCIVVPKIKKVVRFTYKQ